jgi:hypothetical protein
LKLAAVDGYQLICDQACRTAELNESTAGRDEGGFVVLAKVGDGLEVGLESVEDR